MNTSHWLLFCRIFLYCTSEPTQCLYEGRWKYCSVLCCVKSYTTSYISMRKLVTGQFSVLSPVLWVNKIDTYKCTVSESANSCECRSSNICVKGLQCQGSYTWDGQYLLHDSHSPIMYCHILLYLSGVEHDDNPDCKITRIDPPSSHSPLVRGETCSESFVQGMLLWNMASCIYTVYYIMHLGNAMIFSFEL